MTFSIDGTWIAETSFGVVVARLRDDGPGTVDRPAQGVYREPVTIDSGRLVIDDTPLRRVADLPRHLALHCGWYAGAGRTVLLSQVPEAHLGEPMVFLVESDRIVRAHPLDDTHLLAEDGTHVELMPGGLRLSTGDLLTRSTAYRESQVTFRAGTNQLAGTVILPPPSSTLLRASVVVHGAAGSQRDFCRLFAQPLLAADLAVLIYDKPGFGLSEGDGDPTIFDQAQAAAAGMDLLATLSEVDPNRIGLVGFSNGMWSAPMLAARRDDVAFVVGIGAPGVSMAEAEVHRRTKVLREAGVGPATVAAAGEAWRCVFEIAAVGAADTDRARRLDAALRELASASDVDTYAVPEYARENPMLSALPPTLVTDDLITMVSGPTRPQLTYNPAVDYARLRCPVSLQYGSRDSSVPVAASVRAIASALDPALATITVYDGLEHLLNVVPDDVTGLTPETAMYGFHRFRFGETVWSDLTTWLRETLR